MAVMVAWKFDSFPGVVSTPTAVKAAIVKRSTAHSLTHSLTSVFIPSRAGLALLLGLVLGCGKEELHGKQKKMTTLTSSNKTDT